MASVQPEPRVTRGMVFAARAIDTANLSWRKAAERADLDPGHLGGVLKGKPAGRETMEKLRAAFGTDMNLWSEGASPAEREEWEKRMASMRQRAFEAVHGRANP